MNKIEENILRHVEEIGWSIMSVAPRADSDEEKEWWSYTIGLPKSFGWPEVVIFGLGSDTSKALLNDLVIACRDRGTPPAPGLYLDKIIKNHPIKLVDGSDIPDHYINSANWFANQTQNPSPVSKLQFLWPDKSGRFPDDTSCDEGVRRLQTPMERAG
ncbi:MAG: DUF4262 domain-containing protein [Henriciella sp.]|nr:DUF4262 domain-containing protein [Henriciella sp.]